MCTPPFCESSPNQSQQLPLPHSSMKQINLLEMLASLAVGNNQKTSSTDSSSPSHSVNIASCELLSNYHVRQNANDSMVSSQSSGSFKHDSHNEAASRSVNILELLRLCHMFDILAPFHVRLHIWDDFVHRHRTLLRQNPVDTLPFVYFTSIVHKWLQSFENHQILVESFHKTLLAQQPLLTTDVKFPISAHSHHQHNLSNQKPMKQHSFFIPIPNRLVLPNAATTNQQHQPSPNPTSLPHPQPSPWGCDYLSNLEKLVCVCRSLSRYLLSFFPC